MKTLSLTHKDRLIIEKNHLTVDIVNSQFLNLKKGNIPVKLIRPASLDDGILQFSKEKKEELVKRFDENSINHSIIKFVPASGAASRMFGHLSCNLKRSRQTQTISPSLKDYNGENKYLSTFLEALRKHKFAFHDDLENVLKKDGKNFDNIIASCNTGTLLEYILEPKGLNYNYIPKGLVKFHKYSDISISPVGEHFLEAIMYAKGIDGKVNIHFTINKNFLQEFSFEVKKLQELFNNFGYSVNVDFSFQGDETNTISINNTGEIVRDKEGNILLRAGGHGSLIKNLNDLKSDIIFIKNIDNVTTGDRLNDTIEYKKVLFSFLLEIREKIFSSINTLPKIIKDGESINNIYCFSKDVLNIPFPSEFINFELDKKKKILKEKLNRPVRICGMVRNENEPGGGPFWIHNKDGHISLQIVEKSQIDVSIPEQLEILKQSSYFNPVDIVCSTKNYRGEIFDLKDYVEESRYFISEKDYEGKQIKIFEHPGLWNGSMEKWISLFVEVPSSTFNPVKHVNDLLKMPHHTLGNTRFSDLI